MPSDAESAAGILASQLSALGIPPGKDLLVHCSMRQLGPVTGGAGTVLRALQVAAGPQATIVVPAQTTGNSLTSRAFLAATEGLDAIELANFIAAMPGFDPAITPSSGMGALAELVRTTRGAARSTHPQSSFAALGPRAAEAMADHAMDCHLGERSPLGWLYRQDAFIVLLGVGYAACTAFHLAEYRLPARPRLREYRCFTGCAGPQQRQERQEHVFSDIHLDDSDFTDLGGWLDMEILVPRGRVGSADDCRVLPLRRAVDSAVSWPPFQRRRARTS